MKSRQFISFIAATALCLGSLATIGCQGGTAHVSPPARTPAEMTEMSPEPTPTIADASIVVPIPETLKLALSVREDLNTLANASAFGGEAVGYAGTPVPAVAAMRRLVELPEAEEIFARVLEHGTRPAQLLALSGMYYASSDRFRENLSRYQGLDETVSVNHGGCGEHHEEIPIAELVSTPGAMQMSGPDESYAEWAKRNPQAKTLVLDIEGGGYPSILLGR